MLEQAQRILKDVFGYDHFRGRQQAIIERVAGGEDALVLMPTGGGKSLCFQVPALLRDGLAVVVSPLIALMDDQVATLEELGVAAAALNSTLGAGAPRGVAARMAGARLLIVNKFGKHEAEARGFRSLIAEALASGGLVRLG